jgi:endonuclease/exonuclease/phosphatase family metal-dependent hydrolase
VIQVGTTPEATRRIRVVVATIATFAIFAAGPIQAGAASADEGHRLQVMTYNMYIGANLQPLFGIQDPVQLMKAVQDIYTHIHKVDFRVRAVAIARQIGEKTPDVVSLQEVALWQTAPMSDPSDLTTEYNFLRILLRTLDRQGYEYRAVSVGAVFSGALPMTPTTLLKFTDRNAVIMRADLPQSQVKATNPQHGVYAVGLPAPLLGSTLLVTRGWASVDIAVGETSVRIFDTHFEAYNSQIRVGQVAELTQIMAVSPYPVMLAGDLNVYPKDVRAEDATAWALFGSIGLVDSWIESDGFQPAWTAGQLDDLDNVPSNLDNTVDFILHNRPDVIEAVRHSGDIVGEELDDRTDTNPPLWPSDHAGVVITFSVG